MDTVLLGRRLREARLAKKMTQAEVVGEFITRNMLSQIESGAAVPSMKTLEYLSSVLNVPMPLLLDDRPEDPVALLCRAKEALRRGDCGEVIRLLPETEGEPLGDEYRALLARAYTRRAAPGDPARAALLRRNIYDE